MFWTVERLQRIEDRWETSSVIRAFNDGKITRKQNVHMSVCETKQIQIQTRHLHKRPRRFKTTVWLKDATHLQIWGSENSNSAHTAYKRVYSRSPFTIIVSWKGTKLCVTLTSSELHQHVLVITCKSRCMLSTLIFKKWEKSMYFIYE